MAPFGSVWPAIAKAPPSTHVKLCAFTVATNDAAQLLPAVEHNANWANLHGHSFTLYRKSLLDAHRKLHGQWEKVAATRHMLTHRPDCDWLLFIDADAVVVDIARAPLPLLRRMQADATNRTALYGACNSPVGRGLDCDYVCCGRALQPTNGCSVGLRDVGPAIPYPCLINSGVYFIRGGAAGLGLVHEWESQQDEMKEIFGEQESLNVLKERHPELIEVVGGQVMNTPSSFHSRMRAFRRPEVPYDIALRLSTGYEPSIPTPGFDQGQTPLDHRLNVSDYQEAAVAVHGHRLGEPALGSAFETSAGECHRDPDAFICHPFARPTEFKLKMVTEAVGARRAKLERLLSEWRNVSYTPLSRSIVLREHNATRHHRKTLGERWQKRTRQQRPPPPPPTPLGWHERSRKRERPRLSNASEASAGDQYLVLVCVAGELRTFYQPDVQAAFATNVHHAGYEYVVATERERLPPDEERPVLRVAPIIAWVHDSGVQTEQTRLPPCPSGTCSPYRTTPMRQMAAKIALCHAPMRRAEVARGTPYSFVLRIRPDHIFLTPLAHPATLLRAAPRGRILLFDDQVAVARRWLAETVLLMPKEVYKACPTVAQWKRVCSADGGTPLSPHAAIDLEETIRQCVQKAPLGSQPCETMNLIVDYSPRARKAARFDGTNTSGAASERHVVTHARAPLRHRRWTKGQKEPSESGDFCIKRPEWPVDTPDLPMGCRDNGDGGCMDC